MVGKSHRNDDGRYQMFLKDRKVRLVSTETSEFREKTSEIKETHIRNREERPDTIHNIASNCTIAASRP